MRKLVGLLALLLTVTTARADMYQDASNAKLPAAKNNLGIVKSVEDSAQSAMSSMYLPITRYRLVGPR